MSKVTKALITATIMILSLAAIEGDSGRYSIVKGLNSDTEFSKGTMNVL